MNQLCRVIKRGDVMCIVMDHSFGGCCCGPLDRWPFTSIARWARGLPAPSCVDGTLQKQSGVVAEELLLFSTYRRSGVQFKSLCPVARNCIVSKNVVLFSAELPRTVVQGRVDSSFFEQYHRWVGNILYGSLYVFHNRYTEVFDGDDCLSTTSYHSVL